MNENKIKINRRFRIFAVIFCSSIIFAVGDLLTKDKTEPATQTIQPQEKENKCLDDSTKQQKGQEIKNSSEVKENETKP